MVNVLAGALSVSGYIAFDAGRQRAHDDTDEILGFFGTNQDDPESLGGVIEFRFEDERRVRSR